MKYFILTILLGLFHSCSFKNEGINFPKTNNKIVSKPVVSQEDLNLLKEAKEHFSVLKGYSFTNRSLVHLGKKLYLDAGLSKSGTISCNSCHRLDGFGVDNETTSPGHDGIRGDRNSPTSFNAANNIAQFWDGRAKDLADQALGPLLNRIEHGLGSEKEVLEKINTTKYIKLFERSFRSPNAMTFKNIGIAIAEFEKTLVTPGRFDEYLKGNVNALSKSEKKGMKKFIEIGCTSCHYGSTLGGQEYQVLGAVEEYRTKDLGRYNITKDEEDKHVFKVPNLRNIEKTYPYFHDGSIKTLDEAIRIMAKHQLGGSLSDIEIASIRTFLSSLTGKL